MIVGFALSPKLGYQNPAVIKLDEAITSLFYNAHSGNIDDFMILLSMYGREIVCPGNCILGDCGLEGKKNALLFHSF